MIYVDHFSKVCVFLDTVYCLYQSRWLSVGLFYFYSKTLFYLFCVAYFRWQLLDGLYGVLNSNLLIFHYCIELIIHFWKSSGYKVSGWFFTSSTKSSSCVSYWIILLCHRLACCFSFQFLNIYRTINCTRLHNKLTIYTPNVPSNKMAHI